MSDLTVENMFTDKYYEALHVIPALATLNALDRKRMLTHLIGSMVNDILEQPGSNPVGLTVTVTLQRGVVDHQPQLVVKASTPQYDLSQDFFSA